MRHRKRPNGGFCSRECWMGRPKVGQTFKCENCGKDFYRPPSLIKRGIIRYCSLKCAEVVNQKALDFTCQHCGRTLHLKASGQFGRVRRKFCSIACRIAAHAAEMRTPKAKQVKCANCGKNFWICPSSVERRCCSIECKRLLPHRNTRQDNNFVTISDGKDRLSNGKRRVHSEHRAIAAKLLGRPLEYGEEPIIHLDGDNENNEPREFVCLPQPKLLGKNNYGE